MKPRPRILLFVHYYSHHLHQGIAQYAKEAGWSLDTCMYRGRMPVERDWCGIIGTFNPEDKVLDELILKQGIPAVNLSDQGSLPAVLPDHHAVGTMGAEHLIELGYKNFAFFFTQGYENEIMRATGFERRLKPKIHRFYRINSTPRPRIRFQRPETRIRILKRALRRLPKPIGIMACIDDFAVEVLEACEQTNLEVPKEVGVLGVNNDALICDFAPTPLSSVDDDEYRLGYEGAALLDDLMSGRPPPAKPIRIPPKGVILRKSTDLIDIAEVPDRFVARAVRYIADHFKEPISVSTVARQAGISKRMLHDRFVNHIGRSMHEQIVRKRLQCAKDLLEKTDYKTAAIAFESGFGSREQFSKTFKSLTGLSPTAYRQQAHTIPQARDDEPY